MKRLMLALALLSAPVLADSDLPPAPLADTQLADPRQEAQAKALMETIRCLVCQGQSIADSDAELAGDMRAMVRERIAAGEKPAQIRAWLVRRYGSWVSYDPPLNRTTWLLWSAPALFLVVGIMIAARSFRRRRR
jgi:cytochrome c-type biogenesis protein CcmH